MDKKFRKIIKNSGFSCHIFLLLLLIFSCLPGSSSHAAADVEISIDAALDDISLFFQPEITSYTITLTSPQEITVSVSAPGMRINDMLHAESVDQLKHTYTVDADRRLTFRLQTDTGITTYTIIFRVVTLPADESDPLPEETSPLPEKDPPNTDAGPDFSAGGQTDTEKIPETTPPPEQTENRPSTEVPGQESGLQDPIWPEEDLAADSEWGTAETGADIWAVDTRLHIQMNIGLDILFCNDTAYLLDTAPFLAIGLDGNGHTMVPVRFVAEALGATVNWNAAQQQVTIELGEVSHLLTIGQPAAGTAIAACIHDDRTFVPLRYLMESFGAEVAWTAREQRIDIWYESGAR